MSAEIVENLKKSIIDCDVKAAESLAKKAIEEGIDPVQVADILTNTIRQVGEAFGRGELFLPDLIGSAEAMKAAMSIIEGEIKRKGTKPKSLGKVIIGTVAGDIHDIGKSMVATLLMAEGFEVIDLGVDVPAERFVEAVKKHKPDILAMSALLTVTAPEQRKVIEALKKEGVREKVKVMVGGGAITEEFAKSIGADGYDPTAPGAVKLAKSLIGKEK